MKAAVLPVAGFRGYFSGVSAPTEDPTHGRNGPGPELASVRGTLRAVVETIVPEAGDLDEPAWREVEATLEQALRGRPPALRRRLRIFLRFVGWLPLLRYGRTFRRLDQRRRARVLARLQSHRVRLVRLGFWGLRTLALLGYYDRPAAAEAIGYRADPRGWEALET